MEKQRQKLAEARSRKHLTLAQAAEQIGVSIVTVSRWEKGKTNPYSYNLDKVCTFYGIAAAEEVARGGLAPSPEQPHEVTTGPIPFLQNDLTMRLHALALANQRAAWHDLQHLQDRVARTVKEFDHMNTDNQNYQFTRREALCRLATLPLVTLGLSAFVTVTERPAEEVLAQCAAGLAACRQLGRGWYEDITLASQALAAYVPTLKALVRNSSKHRQAAAQLMTRVSMLQVLLNIHIEGPRQATGYARQAVTYSQESGDVPLQLFSLKLLSWTYSLDQQPKQALETITRAQVILQQADMQVPLSIQGSHYAALSLRQAESGLSREADTPLHLALDTFPAKLTAEDDLAVIDTGYNLAAHLRDCGKAYYHMGESQQALEMFSQVMNLETLMPHIAIDSKRTQISLINYAALASLKLPMNRKDKAHSIHLLRAGVEGARALQSEQRFAEARRAYELMEAIWSGDSDVREMHDLFEHW